MGWKLLIFRRNQTNDLPIPTWLLFSSAWLEEYTGKTFEQLLKEIVTDPLDMNNTFASPGNDSSAVIPPSDSSWGSDYGINTP
jgi:CubicO group peptidase (beta-lactamase class C family)